MACFRGHTDDPHDNGGETTALLVVWPAQDRRCRWDSAQPAPTAPGFACFLYDHRLHEGDMDDRWPDGTDSESNPNGFTPLAVPFISLSDSADDGNRYVVFPEAETGFDHTLIKVVEKTVESRSSRLGPDGNGWCEDSFKDEGSDEEWFLYVREGVGDAWTKM